NECPISCEVTEQNYRTKLVLPSVFTEILYSGSPWVYLIHNRGTKHKVWLKRVSGRNNYALFSCDGRYVRVNTLHFIRVAPYEYYVTCYHNDGSECNGYDLDHGSTDATQWPCSVCYQSSDKDPRMRHECGWDSHEEQKNDEKDYFYSPVMAYVTDHNHLTIPWWFIDGHQIKTFYNAYLVYDEERIYDDFDWVFHADRPNRKNHMNIIAP
nr:eukaryotic aspartyl protease family protein [Tanacetum cinerariifolium]